MTPEIYEAMKRRIEVITPESDREQYDRLVADYHDMNWDVVWGTPFYHFSPTHLNIGITYFEEDYIDPITQPMTTRNLWNVCQRFYGFIKHYKDIDKRLLAL